MIRIKKTIIFCFCLSLSLLLLAGTNAWAKTNSFDLSSPLLLVNNKCFLPKSYVPDDLVKVEIAAGDNFQLAKGITLNQTALKELRNMLSRAGEEGVTGFTLVSGYRTYQNQKTVFARKLRSLKDRHGQEEAFSKASEVVAYPGSSEHQTGLAVDISSADFNSLSDPLIEEFVQTRQGLWLKENSWKYGFILRYSEEKKEITGIISEPWHYRYVGHPHAEIMQKNDWCLEEYLYNLRLTGKIEFSSQDGKQYAVSYWEKSSINPEEIKASYLYDGFSGYIFADEIIDHNENIEETAGS